MTIETITEIDTKAQAEAERIASQLRQMADWIEAHPSAAPDLMQAKLAKCEPLKMSFYKLSVLREAFPGCEAKRSRYQDSNIYRVVQDGITFEAWETVKPALPEEVQVVL